MPFSADHQPAPWTQTIMKKTKKTDDVSLKGPFYLLCPQHLLLLWVLASLVITKVNAGLERVNISKPELGMLEKENIQNLKFFGPLQLQTTCDG